MSSRYLRSRPLAGLKTLFGRRPARRMPPTDVEGIVSLVAGKYIKTVQHSVSREAVEKAEIVEKIVIWDKSNISSPRITMRMPIYRTVYNMMYLIFGLLLLLVGILSAAAIGEFSASNIGIYLTIIGFLFIMLYFLFPTTAPYVAPKSENMYICHHCGKLLAHNEAIILPTGESPQFLPAGGGVGSVSRRPVRIKIPPGAELVTLGILGPFGFTMEIKVLRYGFYFDVHCIKCLKKYHPGIYNMLTSRGEVPAIIASEEAKKIFLTSPRKYAVKFGEEFIRVVMGRALR